MHTLLAPYWKFGGSGFVDFCFCYCCWRFIAAALFCDWQTASARLILVMKKLYMSTSGMILELVETCSPFCQKLLLVVMHMASNDVNGLRNCIKCPIPLLLHSLRTNVKPPLHCSRGGIAQNILLHHGQCLIETLDLSGLWIGLLALP
jgi:hypothetical protein